MCPFHFFFFFFFYCNKYSAHNIIMMAEYKKINSLGFHDKFQILETNFSMFQVVRKIQGFPEPFGNPPRIDMLGIMEVDNWQQ